MKSFADSLRVEESESFQQYHELIPNFVTMSEPISKSLINISNLLDRIVTAKQKQEINCENSCMNCSPQLLLDFIGIKTEVKEEQKKPEEVHEKNEPVTDAKIKEKPTVPNDRIVCQISEEEFKTIPKYQLGRFTLESLNEIVGKMDEFLMKKNKILTKSNKQLTRLDRELLDSWRELEMKSKKSLPTTLFFIESDVRPLLQERLRPSFAKAIPCLRHIRRIREERCGPITFYFP